MAQDRLAMLVEGGGGGGDEPNGLRSYLQGTLGLKQPFAVGPRAVRNLLISIEDERLLGIAAFSDELQEDFVLPDRAREAAGAFSARRAAGLEGAQPPYPAEQPGELLPCLALAAIGRRAWRER